MSKKEKVGKTKAAPLISDKEAEKLIAKGKKTLDKDETKQLKRWQSAERAKKYETQADTVLVMNVTKQNGVTITTTVEPIRGVGVRVTESTDKGSVSQIFIPRVKLKKKKAWLYLVEDKPKKDKKKKKSKD